MQRIVILLVVSAIVFEARPGAAGAVLLAAAAGLLASTRLPGRETVPLHPLGFLRFAPWFLLHSFLGGLDVALRAFRGPSSLHPGLVTYESVIREPVVRVIFANTVSLMPGTLTARLEGSTLEVHVLDGGADVASKLAEVEAAVQRAFSRSIP
jgi:multicomponent Na+:H+ antiporter subunit E